MRAGCFLTGERFGVDRATSIGLVSDVVPPENLDGAVDALAQRLLAGSPDAQRRIKQLLEIVRSAAIDDATARTPGVIADARSSPEGQEGLAAFFDKRKPSWAPKG